jgi:hypothetical protein
MPPGVSGIITNYPQTCRRCFGLVHVLRAGTIRAQWFLYETLVSLRR